MLAWCWKRVNGGMMCMLVGCEWWYDVYVGSMWMTAWCVCWQRVNDGMVYAGKADHPPHIPRLPLTPPQQSRRLMLRGLSSEVMSIRFPKSLLPVFVSDTNMSPGAWANVMWRWLLCWPGTSMVMVTWEVGVEVLPWYRYAGATMMYWCEVGMVEYGGHGVCGGCLYGVNIVMVSW